MEAGAGGIEQLFLHSTGNKEKEIGLISSNPNLILEPRAVAHLVPSDKCDATRE